MTCNTIDLGGGVRVIACSRGQRRRAPCETCGIRGHALLCDYPFAGKMTKKTCSAKLCRVCATHVEDLDLCPPHAKVHAAQADLDRARAAMDSTSRECGSCRRRALHDQPPLRSER